MENSRDTVMVVGATGFLGMEICRQLLAANKKVKGLVRKSSDENIVNGLKQMGVETFTGDMKDYNSLSEAFKNVTALISTATATRSRSDGDSLESVDEEGQLNVVKAAKASGVKHVVYISFNPIPGEFPLQTSKRKVENALKESGMIYTILQPTLFMEVWLGPHLGFDYPNAKANIYGTGNNKNSWISLRNVASFAVASLNNEAAKNAVIELGGPDALSPLEVVKIFEEVGGKTFEVQHVPEEALQAQKQAAPDSLSRSFASLMISYAEGGTIDMDETLKKFPVKLISVKDYATQVMAQ
ncbi:MAG TPA: SDR family oxidoreductase [Chitinophagaceae bacterium]|nr:SDR family oxidoreductase [Chitinophagaceae bacterium]